jgi:hypothetical protein
MGYTAAHDALPHASTTLVGRCGRWEGKHLEEWAMKNMSSQSVDLEVDKVQFLEQIAKTHDLPDIGKAIRCLVNYARENPDKHEEMFAEIRCLDC